MSLDLRVTIYLICLHIIQSEDFIKSLQRPKQRWNFMMNKNKLSHIENVDKSWQM